MSTNTAPEAISASAERRLQAMKAERVAAAAAKLAEAKDRATEAQATAEQAAANLAVHEWDGNRKRVLEAENECVLATSLVQHAERALTRAKARTTPEERQAAIDLVTAERARAALMADLAPHLDQIKKAATSLIEGMRAVLDRINQYSLDGLTARDAMDVLEIPRNEHLLLAQPSAAGQVGSAILAACRAAGFSPYDFKDLAAPHTALAPPVVPIAGARVDKLPTAEEEAERLREVNKRFQAQMLAEGERNSREVASTYAQRAGDP